MTRRPNSSRKPADFRTMVIPVGVKAITVPEGMDVQGEIKLKAVETASDKKHRHRMEVREFWVKEAPVHLAAIGIVVGTSALSLFIAARPGYSIDDKKWAVSVLSYLLIAVAGFAFGKAAK